MGHSFGFVCYLIGLGGNGTLLVIGAYGGGVLSNTLLDFLIFFASVAVRFRSVWSGSVRFGSVGRKVCDWHVVIAGDGVLSVEHSFVFLLCFILWGGREQRWIFIGLSLIYLHFLRPFPCFFFIRRDLVLLRTLIIFLSPSVIIPYRYRYTHLIPFAQAKGFSSITHGEVLPVLLRKNSKVLVD